MLSWEIYRFFKTVEAATGGVLLKKGVLKNTGKHLENTGKHLYQSLFLNKVAGLTLVFPCEFCRIFKDTVFWITSGRLLFKLILHSFIY